MELEEAKKILEDICKTQIQNYRNIDGKLEVVKPAYINAIKTVLQALDNSISKEEYKKLKRENGIYIQGIQSAAQILTKDYISKQKIRENIEELEDEIEQLRTEKNVVWDSGIYKLSLKIEILKELLEE